MVPILTIFSEAAVFALYIFVCMTLLSPKVSKGLRVLLCAAVVLCSCAAVMAAAVSDDVLTALTLLPLFAYLPFSVCVYILSEGGLFKAVAACSVATLCSFMAKTARKLCVLSGLNDIFTVAVMLVFAAACGYVVYRFIRPAFPVIDFSGNHMLAMIPIVTVLLMIFDNFSRKGQVNAAMTLIVTVSLFVTAAKMFSYLKKAALTAKEDKLLLENLVVQHENFKQISQSIDAGRIFRHNMRHHLRIISQMAQQDDSADITAYIEKLNESAEFGAVEKVCLNPAVNAVMSEYISRAKHLGCKIEHKVIIPEELPFDLPDVCVIISNALENAINACEKCPAEKRYINFLADYSDERKLKLLVRNSCAELHELDEEGLPIIEKRTDGHGIGLRGVQKLVEKYNGFVRCSNENEEFVFCAEIFRDPLGGADTGNSNRGLRLSKVLTGALAAVVCAAGVLNFSPLTAQALSHVLSVNIRTINIGWGDNSFRGEYPEFTGDNAAELNKAANDFVGEAKEIFREYVVRKYDGYVSEDLGYRVYMDNDKYISVRFFATLNVGGSMDFSRSVTIDKSTGKPIALADLFDEDYDYIGKINAALVQQMEERVADGHIFFIPGGMWREEDCFKTITPDQSFYLTADGRLVIFFEEYAIAPGLEGEPEFIMPVTIYRGVAGE